ncbi:MAG: triphosphoribosyl-dephospho-CoA synthetase [Planctomycetaceae bacterium]|nr:triphosphoribosyl-dephospho-CoA synthetase [Planctomycetaceae bacterium]
MKSPVSIGQAATLACLWEATAPKPGNVHPQAAFHDTSYADYLASAVAIAPSMQQAHRCKLGNTVLASVEATRSLVGRNTNLGTILLLAPLASVDPNTPLRTGIVDVLAAIDREDAALVYAAIRTAQPGGIGRVQKMDVHHKPPDDLMAAMRLAADRDFVARQYAENFATLFDRIGPNLQAAIEQGLSISDAIVHVHLQTMHAFPDSLIARKCGMEIAQEIARRAGVVLAAGLPTTDSYQHAVTNFDHYLRDPQHLRNPGTTADLMAAGLFILLRDGIITDTRGFNRNADKANHSKRKPLNMEDGHA